MNSNDTIRRAILTVLGSTGALAAFAPHAMAADATAAANTGGLEEIVVTAQRRTENLQDVPITIQALSGDQLAQLNVTSMTELLKYTPNVTYSGNGAAGTGNIFMRGLSSGGEPNQSQSTTAPFPNVAVYLDDQSMQFPQRNVDVYIVDLERVEVLEGPQGTLFGGGSQAGAVRYITNKPKLNDTSGNFNASYGLTAGGDPNSAVNGTLNLPLIPGKFAVRATIFSDSRGGYISSVPGSISDAGQPHIPATTNSGTQGSNLNTADYRGLRLSALYQFNDDWNALIQQNVQNYEAHGYWNEEPVGTDGTALQPYQTMGFAPAFEKDRYQSTAWTLNGAVAGLKAVYTGSYMVRHIDGQQDYSSYVANLGDYYLCSGTGAAGPFKSKKPLTCGAPVANDRDQVRNTHQSHEFRVQTPDDKRVRALVGAFYENFAIYDNQNFNYLGIAQCSPANLGISLSGGPDCIAAVGPVAGYYAGNPNPRVNSNTGFGEDIHRGYKQTAFFGSVDVDLIPKTLTLTVGTRHYKYDEFEEGSEYYSYSGPLLNKLTGTVNGAFGMNLSKSESGFKSRANLTWHVTPDIMAYYTFSQGFRPGGFNRTGSAPDGSNVSLAAEAALNANGTGQQIYKPVGFNSDNLVNNEVGLKSEWLDHRLQVNVSAYSMDWKNVQLALFDPTHLGNTTFSVNGPTYTIKGIELQMVARVTEGLTLQGSSSWNSSNQTDTPCLRVDIQVTGGPPVGSCVTQVNGVPYSNPYGALNTAPAFSPPLQFNARARYDWDLAGYKAFWSLGLNYTSHYATEPASYPNGDNPNQPINTTTLKYNVPDYTLYDGAIGIAKDAWNVQLTGNNLGNSDNATSISSGQYIKQVIPLRPRVITLQLGYKF